MSFERAKSYLDEKGFGDRVMVTDQSSATVAEAAAAVGVEEGEIAKSLTFFLKEGPILILVAGTSRVKNRKFKDQFGEKAKMIPFDQVEEATGFAPGGVCPFGLKDGVKIYLDKSLKAYDQVYPACGDDHSAVRLTLAELEEVTGHPEWVDVCK